MKYILLIEEAQQPTDTADVGIVFNNFEDIDYRSSSPFDDRATISYDEQFVEKLKNGILGFTSAVFPGKKMNVLVTRITQH